MRILIIGLACSGKSTFARLVADKSRLPLVHMDKLIWQQNWVKTPNEEFIKLQNYELSQPNWVYEGFNLPTLETQINAADTIIYLQKSHLQITKNYLKRLGYYKGQSRPDMPNGNIEHFSLNYIRWLQKYSNKDVVDEVRKYAGQKPLVMITNNRQATKYINSIGSAKNTKSDKGTV